MKYPNFLEALLSLGNTNEERAAAMGVSLRQFVKYKMGDALPRVETIKRFPVLDEALSRDIRGEPTYTISP